MTDININIPGVRGHTRSTWRDESHLRGLLLKLKKRHPNATRKELEDLFVSKMQTNAALIDEAGRYFFDNHFKSLNDSVQPRQALQPPTQQDRRFVSKAAVTAVMENIKNLVLLDLVMPNGKKLRDCTGGECGEAGGWLLKVAKRVGVNGIVGDKLNETQVMKIFAACSA